jgi:hypothetical protein
VGEEKAVFRIVGIVVFSFVLSFSLDAVALQNPQLAVVVHNDARVPAQVIQEAEGITERIYGEAGIVLVWRDHTGLAPDSNELSVRIVPCSLNLPGEDFGIAFVGTDGRGVQADVFYSGIERLADNSAVKPAQLLGHVMAHELGHLLLGMNSHSSLGIMQAHWAGRQLRQMSTGALKFEKGQAATMGARLLDVSSRIVAEMWED